MNEAIKHPVSPAGIIQMQDVNKWYGQFHVLKDINLNVNQGERIVLCGPSGSGKSTTIRCLNRLEEHQQGRIVVDGVELTDDLKQIEAIRREVGMVFQHFNLFPHLTILQNCTLAPSALRILVVDDNVDAAQLLAMFLEANGYQVAIEHDAVRALALAATIDVDVCLLDIGLPGMDGHELARRLRQLPRLQHALMIAVTGYGRQQDRDAAFAAGFDQHFVKPVSFEDLLSVLHAVIA